MLPFPYGWPGAAQWLQGTPCARGARLLLMSQEVTCGRAQPWALGTVMSTPCSRQASLSAAAGLGLVSGESRVAALLCEAVCQIHAWLVCLLLLRSRELRSCRLLDWFNFGSTSWCSLRSLGQNTACIHGKEKGLYLYMWCKGPSGVSYFPVGTAISHSRFSVFWLMSEFLLPKLFGQP